MRHGVDYLENQIIGLVIPLILDLVKYKVMKKLLGMLQIKLLLISSSLPTLILIVRGYVRTIFKLIGNEYQVLNFI